MKHAKTLIKRFKKISVPFIALLISAYFAAHIFKSHTAQNRLQEDIVALEERQKEIKTARDNLELHVGLLSSDHIDPDYLDELARNDLGFSHPDEIVIPRKK
jgi:cell division protein FtsB